MRLHMTLMIGFSRLVLRSAAFGRPTATPRIFQSTLHRHPRFLSLLMTAVDEDEATDTLKTLDSTWNVAGLKKEVQRNVLRCHKKASKATQRANAAQTELERLTSSSDVTMEELEQCPDVESLQLEAEELRSRLGSLQQLEDLLATEKKGTRVLPTEIAELALSLGVNDEPPVREPRGPPKPKGPRSRESSRLPYRRYFTEDQTEIRVGKQAEDNDELTLRLREDRDWWMHAAGCPGSHVVIRNTDENLPREVIEDAAALAARQSKCQGSVIKVSLTRCRDIRKPPGAKAGLVQLTGSVRTISVNMKEAENRLRRLDATVIVN